LTETHARPKLRKAHGLDAGEQAAGIAMEGVSMSVRPLCCPRCSFQITTTDASTVYNGTSFHQRCFLSLVREEADLNRQRRAYFTLNCKLGRRYLGNMTTADK
jgi:hypothetical protein